MTATWIDRKFGDRNIETRLYITHIAYHRYVTYSEQNKRYLLLMAMRAVSPPGEAVPFDIGGGPTMADSGLIGHVFGDPPSRRRLTTISYSKGTKKGRFRNQNRREKRVYGQSCIETLHESRKRKSIGLFVRISTFTYCINPCDKTKSMFLKEITKWVESIEATTPLWSPLQSALLRRLLMPETETCQCLWHHHSIGLT